jgi:calcineurin-like phosphoesterase family protein
MSIFATADTHFGHKNILQYARRPFITIDDMDATIIANWNSVVGTDDLVVHLGDFAFASDYCNELQAEIKQLRCTLRAIQSKVNES